MSVLETSFYAKSKQIQTMSSMSDEDKLELYKYYKQSVNGDNTSSKPSMFDFVGNHKWNAWNSLNGMSKETAMQKYIDLVNFYLEKK